MNKWKILWLHNGNREDVIDADSLELALKSWREQYPFIPQIALYSITCIK